MSGKSYNTISNWLPVPRFTLHLLIKKFKQFGTTKNLPGHGKKPKSSLRTAWKLCHKVNINQKVVLKDIAKGLDTIRYV